jgi:hypothetical protein
MAWKIERWSEHVAAELPKSILKFDSYFSGLTDRELVLAACSLIDAALVELLSQRLRGDPKEIEDFLGADEDGRAPAGSLGARISLALHTGILLAEDAEILRRLKKIRNDAAHRFRWNFSDKRTIAQVDALIAVLGKRWPAWAATTDSSPKGSREAIVKVAHAYQLLARFVHGRIDAISSPEIREGPEFPATIRDMIARDAIEYVAGEDGMEYFRRDGVDYVRRDGVECALRRDEVENALRRDEPRPPKE